LRSLLLKMIIGRLLPLWVIKTDSADVILSIHIKKELGCPFLFYINLFLKCWLSVLYCFGAGEFLKLNIRRCVMRSNFIVSAFLLANLLFHLIENLNFRVSLVFLDFNIFAVRNFYTKLLRNP
jgi:hypothetical protein